jgi:ATP/maltotriose-dependent transcriptional regulator MalT
MVAWVHAPFCRWEAAAAAQQRALEHARLAGNIRLEARMASAYANSLCDGPTPVATAIARCEEMLERLDHKQSAGVVLNSLACLVALNGDFERARDLYRRARAMLEDIGAAVLAASTSFWLARVELLAGEPAVAEVELRRDYARLEEMGEVFFRTTVGSMLAQALLAQGRTAEAEALAVEVHALAASDDIEVDSICRSVRAKALAGRGEFVEAVRLAEEAAAVIPRAEAPLMRMEALVDLAEVLVASGDRTRARQALEEARELCELKEMAAPLARVEALLDGLGRQAQPVQS